MRAESGVVDTKSWVSSVWERSSNQCENCGSSDRLRLRLIVPEEAGGQRVATNAVVHCRTCEFGEDHAKRCAGPASGDGTRPINFWVSRTLYERLHTQLSDKYGFRSVASLVRYLMDKFVGDPEHFDDVGQYQETGADVKVNVWVPRDSYSRFKVLAEQLGLTVTDALKGLIRMYEMEIDRVVSSRSEKKHVR